MLLLLTGEEIRILSMWANNTIHGGHWGNGNFLLDEESDLLKKIQDNAVGGLELNSLEIRVLEFWREDNHKEKGNMTGSRIASDLAGKIKNAYEAVLRQNN